MVSRAVDLKSSLLTGVTFGAVGPLFGTLAFAVWSLSLTGDQLGPVVWLMAALWMLPFGYLIGVVPAALTGLVVGLFRSRLAPLPFVGISALAGFVATWGLAALTSTGPVVEEGGVNLGLIGAVAGGFSALISRAVGRRRQVRPKGQNA